MPTQFRNKKVWIEPLEQLRLFHLHLPPRHLQERSACSLPANRQRQRLLWEIEKGKGLCKVPEMALLMFFMPTILIIEFRLSDSIVPQYQQLRLMVMVP